MLQDDELFSSLSCMRIFFLGVCFFNLFLLHSKIKHEPVAHSGRLIQFPITGAMKKINNWNDSFWWDGRVKFFTWISESKHGKGRLIRAALAFPYHGKMLKHWQKNK